MDGLRRRGDGSGGRSGDAVRASATGYGGFPHRSDTPERVPDPGRLPKSHQGMPEPGLVPQPIAARRAERVAAWLDRQDSPAAGSRPDGATATSATNSVAAGTGPSSDTGDRADARHGRAAQDMHPDRLAQAAAHMKGERPLGTEMKAAADSPARPDALAIARLELLPKLGMKPAVVPTIAAPKFAPRLPMRRPVRV